MNNNNDWNDKKEGFIEVLKLMEMINNSKKSEWHRLAMLIKDMFDSYTEVGFTRQEALELTKAMIGSVGGPKNV